VVPKLKTKDLYHLISDCIYQIHNLKMSDRILFFLGSKSEQICNITYTIIISKRFSHLHMSIALAQILNLL